MPPPFDFKALEKVSAAETRVLREELNEAEWARYGRNIQALMETERFLTAVNCAVLRGGSVPEIARRIKLFLTTGTIAS